MAHTLKPWNLIWHGNEQYPFPLSIHSEDGEEWIARDGTVSSEAYARLIAAAPELLAALKGIIDNTDPDPHDPWRCRTLNNGFARWEALIAAADAAIAKAEGKSGAHETPSREHT